MREMLITGGYICLIGMLGLGTLLKSEGNFNLDWWLILSPLYVMVAHWAYLIIRNARKHSRYIK